MENKEELYNVMYNVMYREIEDMKKKRYKNIMESRINKTMCLNMMTKYNQTLERIKYLEENKKDLEIDFYRNFNISITEFNKLYLDGE